ncbi:MAG: CoA pyrophosphatase [Planctomycetales bacterium]|nr:CoA pyrophosphatase [Planctomycetales bacterium]
MLSSLTAGQLEELLLSRLALPTVKAAARAWRRQFSPSLSYGRHFGPPSPSSKPAAVLIVLERGRCAEEPSAWSIPLTVRPEHLPDHPGQISLPGGRVELGETHQQAAEREFCEELGPVPFTARVLASLEPINVYNSDYYVRPFLAISETTCLYRPCQREVARVVHLPVEYLIDGSHFGRAGFSRGNVCWSARTIQVGHDSVWGATAIMLSELIAILAEEPSIFRDEFRSSP